MTTPELYASIEGRICQGTQRCHWCGAGCSQTYLHNEPPPVIGAPKLNVAKIPSSPYICHGCWLFRRGSITITFPDESRKDRCKPLEYGWFLTPGQALGIKPHDTLDEEGLYPSKKLYEILLNPPPKFSLSIIDKGTTLYPQLTPVNDFKEIAKDTTLLFSLNNIQHNYTVYELEEALREPHIVQWIEGKPNWSDPKNSPSAGVRALLKRLGEWRVEAKPERLEGHRGRPPALDDAKTLKEIVGKKK